MVLMKTIDLSYAYPITAISFVLVSMIGLIFFGEVLTVQKLLGLGLLLIGVYLSMMSK
jgi:multidrug transporter EmrE-like cation transporter